MHRLPGLDVPNHEPPAVAPSGAERAPAAEEAHSLQEGAHVLAALRQKSSGAEVRAKRGKDDIILLCTLSQSLPLTQENAGKK